MKPGPKPRPIWDRFWEKVDASGDCWEWLGNRRTDGYGRMKVRQNGERKDVYAHRLVWELLVGPIPEDRTIDHLCFNTSCVNPSHLRVVTNATNVRSARYSYWRARTHCANGHRFEGNSYVQETPKGWRRRVCRPCAAAASKRYRDRKVTA